MQSDKQTVSRTLPECWGHRGASSRFPENTLASFEAAIRDGAEGVESDVHVSKDDVVIMFHDPVLTRTTNSSGHIKDRVWLGEDGMEHVRTLKEPKQAIPTFTQTLELLMKPENQHVKFNVDVKVQNDPARLFRLMHEAISAHAEWQTLLAPRILLGLWHPCFLVHAKEHLGYCKRSYIGVSTESARKYFWKECDTFSMSFGSLTTTEGQKFLQDARKAGKSIMVWTVNEPSHMTEAVRWGVDVIITDTTRVWLDLRSELQADYDKKISQHSRLFLWTTLQYYSPVLFAHRKLLKKHLEGVAGSFDCHPTASAIAAAA